MHRRSFFQSLVALICVLCGLPGGTVDAAARRRGYRKFVNRQRKLYRRRVRHAIKASRVPVYRLF